MYFRYRKIQYQKWYRFSPYFLRGYLKAIFLDHKAGYSIPTHKPEKIFKKINDLNLPMKFQRSYLRVYKNITLYRSFKKSMLK